MINKEMFYMLADHFDRLAEIPRRHKPSWDQQSYGGISPAASAILFKDHVPTRTEIVESCGTHACIAGWTVLLAGDPSKVVFERKLGSGGFVYETAVKGSSVEEYAKELLGLNWDQVIWLFSSSWSPDDVTADVDYEFTSGYRDYYNANSPTNLKALARTLRFLGDGNMPHQDSVDDDDE